MENRPTLSNAACKTRKWRGSLDYFPVLKEGGEIAAHSTRGGGGGIWNGQARARGGMSGSCSCLRNKKKKRKRCRCRAPLARTREAKVLRLERRQYQRSSPRQDAEGGNLLNLSLGDLGRETRLIPRHGSPHRMRRKGGRAFLRRAVVSRDAGYHRKKGREESTGCFVSF